MATDQRGRWVAQITVPALRTGYPVRAPFVPDWWRVSLADAISTIITVHPGSRAQIGGVPLTGTGQWAFPAEGDTDDSILIDNPAASDIAIQVYASVGFPPDSYIPPLSLALATSISTKSNTRQASINFAYNHNANGPILAMINIHAAGTLPQVTSITLGGITGIYQCGGYISDGGARYAGCVWYLFPNAAAGAKQFVATFSAGYDLVEVSLMSFDYGVSFGNTGAVAIAAGGAFNVVIVGSKATNVLFCGCTDTNFSGGTPTESSGAALLDSYGPLAFGGLNQSMKLVRVPNNLGSYTFVWTVARCAYGAAIEAYLLT